MTRVQYQIVVIGSGFGGSLMAMVARRLGFSVALVERGKHPRFAIGESSTPLANLLLEQLATDYGLDGVRPLCKWGTWQEQTPQIACGLKRGFTFFQHTLGRRFETAAARQRQLMIGASPVDRVSDTHWYRAEFDHFLVGQARSLGVDYFDEVELSRAESETGGMRLEGTRQGKAIGFRAELVIDGSGPRGFLHRSLGLPEKALPGMPRTQALFSHFARVGPLPDAFFSGNCAPPYPAEAAAVHHIFEEGWVWVLKFNNGLTSAGVAATDEVAASLNFQSGEGAWRRLLGQLPSLAESFGEARAVLPFLHQPRVAFQSRQIVGQNWLLLPSAAGVVDPLLSTGIALNLLGVVRVAEMLQKNWGTNWFGEASQEYARMTTLELETTARLVGGLYATMNRFRAFKALSLLYFAAVSYSETARRLGKPELARGFLLCEHPEFSRLLRDCCELARGGRDGGIEEELENQIYDGIRRFDIAGLTDRSREPWHPARIEDIYANAWKLGASEAEVESMLKRCGMLENGKVGLAPAAALSTESSARLVTSPATRPANFHSTV